MTRTTWTLVAILAVGLLAPACPDTQPGASEPEADPGPPPPPPPPFPVDDAVLDVVRFEAVDRSAEAGADEAAGGPETADRTEAHTSAGSDTPAAGSGTDPAEPTAGAAEDAGDDGRLDLTAAARGAGPRPIPIPPGAALHLELWQRLVDYRVRLVDASDRLVPFSLESGQVSVRSRERPEPGGTWIRLTPTEPLTPGTGYVLKIEGELSDRVEDGSNRRYDDLVLPLKTTGEKPPPPPRRRGRRR